MQAHQADPYGTLPTSVSPCQFHDLTGDHLGSGTVGLHPLVGQKVEGLSFLEQRTHSL